MIRVPLFPDATQPVTEVISFLTDVISSENTREQRIVMRERPKRSFSMRMVELGSPWAAALMWYIEAGMDFELQVAFWPEAVQMTEDAPIGTTVFNTTRFGERFEVPGEVLLWRSEDDHEFCALNNFSPVPGPHLGAMVLGGGGVTKDWIAGHGWVVPCFVCRLASVGDIERPNNLSVILNQLTVELIPR